MPWKREGLEIGLRFAQGDHLTEFQQQRGTLEIELAQKNMSVQNLRERIQQKYRLNLDDNGPMRYEAPGDRREP